MNAEVTVRATLAAVFIVIGLLIVLVSLGALLDPVGTKHADDGDPFGPPPSRLESTAILLFGCGFLVLAALLVRAAVRRARAAGSSQSQG